MSVDRRLDGLPEAAAVPRRNGELVFAAPWEGRAFGMAMALAEAGVFEWEDFRRRLIDRIKGAPEAAYYQSWLGAFEDLLLARQLVGEQELAARVAEFRSLQREGVF